MIGTSDMRAGIFEGRDGETSIEWMVPDKVRTVMNCRGWLQFTDAEGRGYALDLTEARLHHEIYLSDARKVAPEKLKTVIRHPIAPAATAASAQGQPRH